VCVWWWGGGLGRFEQPTIRTAPLCELARLGGAQAGVCQGRQDPRDDAAPAMHVQLHHILAREALGA
jgi:hypothetical protein